MSEAETLLVERLRANLELSLGRVARINGIINSEAISDITNHAIEAGAFRLTSTGRLETLSGESAADWCKRLVADKAFYGAPTVKAVPPKRRVDLSRATASERLEFANEVLARGDDK